MLSRLMTRREQIVVVFLAGTLLLGSVTIFLVRDPASASVETPLEIPATEVQPLAESASSAPLEIVAVQSKSEVVVSLVGDIARPGVYTLEAGSRIQDLLLAAGGATTQADTSDINLAAKLIDGTTLIVHGIPSQANAPAAAHPNNIPEYTISGWQSGSVSGSPGGGSLGGLININRATQSELETLPGVGPKYAQEIIRYRTATPFANTLGLLEVSGIGPKRYEAIRDLVTVR